MTEKTETADQPAQDEVVTVGIEMDAATRQALASLVAPVTLWARSQGAPDPALGDIVGLAVRLMHATVFAKAHDMLATKAGEAAPRAMH